jgi:nucleoid DNA-binding protein
MIQIENYISGFLLKNKFCAIAGLGSLELKRESAQIRNEDRDVYPPSYTISFSPLGVVDDGFATYIANHENVSISKSSNDIKTFSQDVKRELKKTGRYELEGVGLFTYKNETIQFIQDDTLDLGQDPIKIYQERDLLEDEETLADAKSFKDLNYTHSEKGMGRPQTGTLIKYLLSLLLLIGLAAGAYYAYNYYQQYKVDNPQEQSVATVEDFESTGSDDTTYNADEALETSTAEADEASSESSEGDGVSAVTAPTRAAGEYKVAVQAYDNAASAKAKSDKLNSWDNKTTVVQKGNTHYVVVYATSVLSDTTAIKDSLRKYFNPSGKPFMVK